MTPKELEAAVAGAIGVASAPLSRRDLEELMARFPDRFPDLGTEKN